jgi:hypothetical protein
MAASSLVVTISDSSGTRASLAKLLQFVQLLLGRLIFYVGSPMPHDQDPHF